MLIAEIFDSKNDMVFSSKPLSLKVNLSVHIPAHSLVVIFPFENYVSGETILLYKDEDVVFKGIIDEEQRVESCSGRYVKLIARSLMAHLLDNETEPVVINFATSTFLGERYLKPFSIPYDTAEDIMSSTINGELGATVYQVLSAFSNEVYSCNPYISPKGEFSFKGCRNMGEICFSNTDGVKFNSLTEYRKPCEEISEIRYMLNNQGYCYSLENPERRNSSVKRVRYLDCRLNSETTVNDGEILIRNSQRESYCVKIVCPSLLLNCLGSSARVDVSYLSDRDFVVSEITATMTSKGYSSEVTLVRKEDYYVAD